MQTYRENGKNIPNFLNPRAIVFYVHGLFAHQNRCAHVAKAFAEIGVTTVGFDFRGHGKSQGLPGYIEDFNDLMNDFINFATLMEGLYSKEIPKFLIGESMGGLIGYLFGLKTPNFFKGMIFLAPSLQESETKKMPMKFAYYLSYFIKSIPIPLPRKNESSKNPAVFENVRSEPLIYNGGIRFGTMANILTGMELAKNSMEKFIVPFLMVQGGMDNIVNVECNIDLVIKATAKDKTLVFYENLWHNVLHEDEIKEILPFMVKWVDSRVFNEKEKEIMF